MSPPSTFRIRRASPQDAPAIATLAAATFPLAAPGSTPAQDIADHIEQHLNAGRFLADISTDGTVFFVADDAETDAGVLGYAMLVRGVPPPIDIECHSPVELRRIYVAADHHGQGSADALMERCLHHARTHGYDVIWLGTNEENRRAIAFYQRHGFSVLGSRNFMVGTSIECDHVMARPVDNLGARAPS